MHQGGAQGICDVPRLRYYHFAMWILGAASLTLLQEPQLRDSNTGTLLDRYEVSETAWQSTYRRLTSAAVGVQLTLIAFGAAWRTRNIAVPNQPGHLLIVFHVVVYACAIASQAWSSRIEEAADDAGKNEMAKTGLLFLLVWSVGVALASTFLARANREGAHWRAVYILLALVMAIVAFPAIDAFLLFPVKGVLFRLITPLDFQRYAPLVISASLFAAILNGLATDVVQERWRDWAHWMGAAVYLLSLGLTLANQVMML